jgi:tetratricopeptide (TPR) repeat protein
VALKGGGLTTRQIADTLGVRHLLEGAVRRAGDRVRVSVDLIDARTDAHVWANSYERDLTDVFRVQEDIARQVVEALVASVGGLPAVRPTSHTNDPEAYAAYLRGKYLLHRRTAEGLRGAIREFEHAITIDSAYAAPYAGLASAYGLTATYDYTGIDLYVAYGRALAVADRAIALDSNLAEAYAARGYVETRAWAPTEPIGRDFKRALARRPNSADVHGWYAHYLSRIGQHAEALIEAERAIELDPLAPGRRVGIAIDALGARRYDLAAREAEAALTLEPSLTTPRYHLALAQLLRGQPQQCLEGSVGPFAGVRALCLQSLGRTRDASTIIDSLRSLAEHGRQPDSGHSAVIPMRSLATYYAWVGDVPQTLVWLQRAYALSPEGEDFRVIDSGVYDRVRTDPRFQAGLEQLRREMYEHLQREALRARGR